MQIGLGLSIGGGTKPPAPAGPVDDITTSYDNLGGTGNRLGFLVFTTNIGIDWGYTASKHTFIDGDTSNVGYFSTTASNVGKYLRFDTRDPEGVVVDAIRLKQSSNATYGSSEVQGSMNNTDWTTLRTSFTLGGSTEHEVTFTNTTRYRSYQLIGVSGNYSGSPYIKEIDLKISKHKYQLASCSWVTGDRTAAISMTGSDVTVAWGRPRNEILNGSLSGTLWWLETGTNNVGKKFVFDFGTAKLVNAGRLYIPGSTGGNIGTWQWKKSSDGSLWTNIGDPFVIQMEGLPGSGSYNIWYYFQQLHQHREASRYLAMECTVNPGAQTEEWGELEFFQET